MKVGLYFGSFNPIHIGHLIIANYVANNTLLDEVWFVISPQNPLKKERTLLNEQHRKHLIDLAIDGEKKLRTSNVEFRLPKPSYTVNTLTYLSEKYPKYDFSIIMGSDSFSNIRRWKNYEVLLRDYKFYIYQRRGFLLKDLVVPKVFILNAPLLEISSTLIRYLIKKKKSIRFLVPDIVKNEIENQVYYKDQSNQ